jgi:DNA segregation ATPase FtsK/SpoIIIE-like protein
VNRDQYEDRGPDDRIDMGTIFKKLAGNKKGLSTPAANTTNLSEGAIVADEGDLVKRAIDMLKGEKVAYTKDLQFRLHIGWGRADELMNELEKLGVVGSAKTGGRGREVLVKETEVASQ